MHSTFPLARTLLIACLAATITPTTGFANIVGFGDFSNFTVNKASGDIGGAPVILANKIQLVNGSIAAARSIFHNTPQNISQFTATFTYQAINGKAIDGTGAAFVIHNVPEGAHAVGDPFFTSAFGYGGIASDFRNININAPSAAISLELSSATGTALYTGGAGPGGAIPTNPVNLLSGHPIHVTLAYNGTLLQETLLDTVTSAVFFAQYPINLPLTVGGSTAFVGFTAGNGQFSGDAQYISDFHFNSVPEPSSLVLLASAGLACAAYRRRRRSA